MSQTRSIFEDVSTQAPQNAPIAKRDDNPKSVKIWLWLLFALVVVMILVGGLTRLTDSGLSITDWNLVMGSMPPMNDVAWAENFAKYQSTKEFQLQNASMTLAQYKGIFWWEWGHRFLGRIIGLVWILGFVVFALRKQIRRDRLRSIFALGVFIGLQGVVGILMVKSGYLGDRVDVASYALAIHLGMAFIILGILYWNIKYLSLTPSQMVEARRRGDEGRARFARVLTGFVFLQIILGALVAGIDGGMSYNDWPMMGGEYFSSDAFLMSPWWRNFFENPALVQFLHRMNGYLVAGLAIYMLIKNWHPPYKQWKFVGRHFMLVVAVQILMGIMTLIHHVPLGEAITHQAVAIAVWIMIVGAVFAFRFPRVQTIRG